MVTQTLKRYDRQIILPEIGITGQQNLQEAKVLVVGAGGLGCPILMYLAGAGVGKIGIVDNDEVELSNLHRQVLYHVADIGRKKAELAAEKLRLLNPEVEFIPLALRLNTENAAEILQQYDLIIDGSDNFPTRYLVNDTCIALNKPLVFGSIYKFEGQVSVFNYQDGPDYRSIYPEPPLAEDTQNCGEAGVIATLPGIIGSLMANEAIKIICGFGTTLSGQLLVFNTLNNETQLLKFGKSLVKEKTNTKTVSTSVSAEVSLTQLKEWDKQLIAYQLIDVRETYEFEEFNIGGINIPLYELKDRLNELELYQRVVFCCEFGKRSKIAIQLAEPTFKGMLFSLIPK